MQVAQPNARTWRFPRLMVDDQVALAAILWVTTVIVTYAIVLIVDRFFTVNVSAWEIAVSVAHWYIGIIVGWLMFAQVPMFVAHGRTRRDATIEAGMTAGILVGLVSVLMTLGYLIEEVIYQWADWPGVVDDNHLFSSRTDVGMIFLENILAFLVWALVGGFVGISLYRSDDLGWFALLPAALILGLTGSFDRTTGGFFGIITRFIPVMDVESVIGTVLIGLIGMAIAGGAAWLVVRDMPLRNK